MLSPMTDIPDASTDLPPRVHRWIVAVTTLLAFAVVVVPVLMDTTTTVPAYDWFVGADTHMRMVRVIDWWRGGDWYGNFSPRSNWPMGETLHWTRPLDILLVALAWPLMPFVGEARAFYWAGAVVSPLLVLGTFAALLAAARPLLDVRGRVVLLVLFVTQPISRYYFSPGRPDHHSLLLFLFTVALALLAALSAPADPKRGPAATVRIAGALGAVIGLAVWTSVEAMVTACYAFAFLGLAWLVTGDGRRWLGHLRITTWSALAVLSAALMLERPPHEVFAAVEYDRLSIVHGVLFAATAVATEGLWRLAPRIATPPWRWLAALGAGAFVVAVLAAAFPVFFKGPFGGAMNPHLQALWLDNVIEVKPLFRPDDPFTLGRTVRIASPALFAAVWVGLAWRRPFDRPAAVGLLALGGVLFFALTLYQVRWGAYFAVVVALPWAALVQELLDWRGGPKLAGGVPVWRVPLVGGVVLLPMAGAVAAVSGVGTEPPPAPVSCPWHLAVPVFDTLGRELDRPVVVFTQIHQGPEILYRSAHRVVGTPYHRNAAGIIDSFAVFTGKNMAEVREILARRQVDVLALCVGDGEARHYLKTPGQTLVRRLTADNPPEWLIKMPSVAGPPGLEAGVIRLYRRVP